MFGMKKQKLTITGIICSVIILLMLAAAWLIYQELPDYGTYTEEKMEEQFVHDLWEGTVIEQEFSCVSDCEFISLEFSDHDRQISGKTHFLIREKEGGKVVCNLEIENDGIHYLEPVKLYLENGGRKDKAYVLMISVLENPGDCGLGLFGYIPDEGGPVCSINGQVSEYAVSIGTHADTLCYKIHFGLVLVMLLIMLFLCVFFTEFRLVKPEILFLCIAVPVGIIFISYLNVNIVHDGSAHLTTAYQYSNRLLGIAQQDSIDYVYLSPDEMELRKETDNFYILLNRIFNKVGVGEERQAYHEQRPTGYDSILEYFPGIFGITLGRLLRLSAMSTLLIAKIFCLTFYILICFWAIREAPVLKRGFLTAALLPMNLYQASGITYDAVTIPVTYLVLAMILKGRQERLKRGEWICLFVLSMILGSCKGGIYIPVLLLLVFIQSGLNGGIKRKIEACAVSWILSGGTLLYTYRESFRNFFFEYNGTAETSTVSIQTTETVKEISWAVEDQVLIPKYSLRHLFTDPFDFIKMFIRTMFEKTDYYLGSMIGNRMAWSESEISWTIIILFIILLVLAISWEENEQVKDINVIERIAAGLLLICELVGFHAIMLVETHRGASTIFGVQGRYFLPLIPLFMFSFYTKSRRKTYTVGNREFFFLCVAHIMYIFNFTMIIYK